MAFAEGQPGFQFGPSLRGRRGVEDTLRATPAVSTPTEFTPAVTQQRSRITGQPELFAETVGPRPEMQIPETAFTNKQEQLAFEMNQKMQEQKLATLDTIINLRMSLDEAGTLYPNMRAKEKAVVDAVTRLRGIEDGAIDAISQSNDQVLSLIGRNAKSTKSALANFIEEEKLLAEVTRKDAIGFANAIDGMDPQRVGAIGRIFADKPETRNKIVASYLEQKINSAAGRKITKLDAKMADNLEALVEGKTAESKDFIAKIELLTGDKTINEDIKKASAMLKRATSAPIGPARNKLSGEAVNFLANRFSRIRLNPFTWINLLGPDNSTYAQKIVKQLFTENREAFLDSIVTSPESVLQSVVSLEQLFGKAALPMTSFIVNRATQQGILTGGALAALKPGANATPAPMQ
jgi:hypothetical protein